MHNIQKVMVMNMAVKGIQRNIAFHVLVTMISALPLVPVSSLAPLLNHRSCVRAMNPFRFRPSCATIAPTTMSPTHASRVAMVRKASALPNLSFSDENKDKYYIQNATSSLLEDRNRVIHVLRPMDRTLENKVVSVESTYTQTWSKEDWDRHCSSAIYRYVRHLKFWPMSSTARRILPAVSLQVLWALVVSVVTRTIFPQLKSSMNIGANTILLAPLVLLLTLRTNASLGRMLEARGAWGRTVLHARIAAGFIVSYVIPINPRGGIAALRCLCAFGWSMKARQRSEEVDDVLKALLLTEEEAKWVQGRPKKDLALLARVRQIISVTARGNELNLASHQLLEQSLVELESCQGICERLYSSPTPPTYTRHTSRVLTTWLFLLPVALVGTSSLPAVIMSSMIASYILIGIDEIGVEIEHPFPYLPLQQLSIAVMDDVIAQLEGSTTIPSLPDEFNKL